MSFYQYHPHSAARLGFSIDPRRPFDDKSTGGYLSWKSYIIDNGALGAELKFEIKEVTNRIDLYKMMSLDIKIEAKFGLTKASSSLNWETETKFNENSIIYVVSASKTYLPEIVKGELTLSDEGLKAWDYATKNESILNFQRVVGSEVVTQIRRGNHIALIYSFNCASLEQKEQIKSKLDAGWATGNLNVDFRSEFKLIDESLSLNVYGYQSGIGTTDLDNADLSEVIRVSPGEIVEIRRLISEILQTTSIENRDSSPIIDLNTMQVSDIKEILNSKYYRDFVQAVPLNNMIDEACVNLNNHLIDNEVKYNSLLELLSAWNQADFKIGSKKIIEEKLRELSSQKLQILKTFSKVINAEKLGDCIFNLNTISVLKYSDVVVLPFIVPLSWNNYIYVYQEGFNVDFGSFTTYFFPTVHIKFPRAIKCFYMIKNNQRIDFFNKESVMFIDKNGGSFKDKWVTTQQDNHVYVWAWHAPFVEETKIRKNNEHILRDMANEYKLEVIMDDGSTHEVLLGNAGKPITLPIEYFSNVELGVLNQYSVGVKAMREANQTP